MANQALVRIAMNRGLAQAMIGDDLKHDQILNENYLPDGRRRPEVIQAQIPLVPIPWYVASLSAGQIGQRIELPQPGTIERFAAYVTTAPSGGDLVVILTSESDMTAPDEIARVTIAAGSKKARTPILPQSLPAGTWLGIQLGTPNSAAGLSVTAAFRAEA